MDKDYNINMDVSGMDKDGNATITVRHAVALEERPPREIDVCGGITAPFDFLSRKQKLFDPNACHLLVLETKGVIKFIINETDPYNQGRVMGSLTEANNLLEFGINEEVFYTSKELAQFLKVNLFYFVDEQKGRDLIKQLLAFRATVETIIEDSDNQRGQTRKLLEKKADTDISETMTLKLPIYEGADPVEFDVFIGVECTASDVKFYLESVELYKLKKEVKKELLAEQIAHFDEWGCSVVYC